MTDYRIIKEMNLHGKRNRLHREKAEGQGKSSIKYPESALKSNAEYIIQLAESEGMKAHALAVKVRK